jgi:hypothetical protein
MRRNICVKICENDLQIFKINFSLINGLEITHLWLSALLMLILPIIFNGVRVHSVNTQKLLFVLNPLNPFSDKNPAVNLAKNVLLG